jgi:hypothetical protein
MQTPSSSANVAPVHASSETQSARSSIALKGNRLDRANVTADRTLHSRSKIEIVNGNRKVPIGCEVAFSRLVAKDNVPVRCLTWSHSFIWKSENGMDEFRPMTLITDEENPKADIRTSQTAAWLSPVQGHQDHCTEYSDKSSGWMDEADNREARAGAPAVA